MKRLTMTWRSTTWTRWLGWSLVYTLVTYGIGIGATVLSTQVPPDSELSGVDESVIVRLPLLMALVIGGWFGSWWWVLGPPVALLLPSFVGLMIADILAPSLPSDLGQGYLLFWFVAVLSWIPAIVGVAINKAWHYLRRPAGRL